MLKNKNIIKNNGFSLIEVMVAFVVLTVGLFAIIGLFPRSLSISKSAQVATQAYFLSQDKIEEVFSLGYDGIAIGTIEPKAKISTSPDSWLYNFQRETKTSYIQVGSSLTETTASDTGIKKITSTVYYFDTVSRKEKSYSLSTMLSKN